MFKQRVLTALCLIPLVLWGIHSASITVIGGLLMALSLLAAVEWAHLIPVKSTVDKVLFYALMGMALLVSLAYPTWWSLIFLIWPLLMVLIVSYPRCLAYWSYPLVNVFLALMLLPGFFISCLKINQMPEGSFYFIYLLFLVWAADTGAYCAGKLWGKHKLIPQVSPGKTLQGLAGGLALSCLVMLVGAWTFEPKHWGVWFGFNVIIVLLSVFGDLFISMLKRQVDVKDTGHILPGHGGVLDRLDSLIAASPLFLWGLNHFGFGF